MGVTEILTIIFVVCKIFGAIDWSWWLVFLPEIIAIVVYLVIWIVGVCQVRGIQKETRKKFDDFKF